MSGRNKSVLIAGATGYLGKSLIRAYSGAGYRVRALTRREDALSELAPYIDEIVVGEATDITSIQSICDDIDLVVSALGITRQKDDLRYEDVDYQANRNLLDIAIAAEVNRFTFIHILNALMMPRVAVVKAKSRFVTELVDSSVNATIICPSGFFSDLSEVFAMAKKGRAYILGDGERLISPIHGHDLAERCIQATEAGQECVEVGGPDTFTQVGIADLAFSVLGKPAKITFIPTWVARLAVRTARLLGLRHFSGPIELFLHASTIDMSAPPCGDRHLIDEFARLASDEASPERPKPYSSLPQTSPAGQ